MKNVGSIDRCIRFLATAALVAVGFFSTGSIRIVFWVVALVPLLTGAFSFCPLWMALRINTNKK